MSLSTQISAAESVPEPAATPAEEAGLVRAAVAGEVRAFDAIVHRYSRRVFNYLYQMTRQAQDAEDLAQQTFIKAYASLDRFDPTRPLIAWLLTIARRTALNHFRAARRWEEVPEDAPAAGASPAQNTEERDEIENLWTRARQVLSPREYEILWLRCAENLSVAETARVAGLTQPHVKIIAFRARAKLAKYLPAP